MSTSRRRKRCWAVYASILWQLLGDSEPYRSGLCIVRRVFLQLFSSHGDLNPSWV
jgi:hypothetical protein